MFYPGVMEDVVYFSVVFLVRIDFCCELIHLRHYFFETIYRLLPHGRFAQISFQRVEALLLFFQVKLLERGHFLSDVEFVVMLV